MTQISDGIDRFINADNRLFELFFLPLLLQYNLKDILH